MIYSVLHLYPAQPPDHQRNQNDINDNPIVYNIFQQMVHTHPGAHHAADHNSVISHKPAWHKRTDVPLPDHIAVCKDQNMCQVKDYSGAPDGFAGSRQHFRIITPQNHQYHAKCRIQAAGYHSLVFFLAGLWITEDLNPIKQPDHRCRKHCKMPYHRVTKTRIYICQCHCSYERR